MVYHKQKRQLIVLAIKPTKGKVFMEVLSERSNLKTVEQKRFPFGRKVAAPSLS